MDVSHFIQDFQASGLVQRICTRYDIIMIWVSGSNAIGLTDDQSDYDLGVLVADPIIFSKTKKDPEYYVYKLGQVGVQCVYNSLDDVAAEEAMGIFAPYRYLGWAQFKYLTEDFIIYKNPKYADLIESLIMHKQKISTNAIYAFLNFWKPQLQLATTPTHTTILKWGKMLSHICWCVEELEGVDHNLDQILRLKRLLSNQTGEHIIVWPEDLKNFAHQKIVLALQYLQQYSAEGATENSIKNLLNELRANYKDILPMTNKGD